MLFSVYYRIQNRDRFFERFCKRYIKTKDLRVYNSMVDTYEELMEVIVKMLLDNDSESMQSLLTKNNTKMARVFFDYFTDNKTRQMKKTDIEFTLTKFFNRESEMKDIKSFLEEAIKPIKLTNFTYEPFKLNEADDDADAGDAGGDDPFGDDDAGGDDPFGGDDGGDGGDPFGDDAGGAGGDDGDDADGEDEDGEGEDDENPEDELDLEGHEDDPDFTEGATDDDVVTPSPAGPCIYDVDGIMQSINAVIESLPDNQLAEIEAVKKAVTLIFNGKILKPEDVTFQNPKNASFLIKQIGKNVDEKTRNYMLLKVKQPLIKLRDKNKEELAAMKNDTNNIRDTLMNFDK